jgi:hypothetical protein
MQPAADPRPAGAPRGMSGLLLLLILIVLGMGVTGAYYQWKAPAIIAERRALLASEPKDPEARLDRWLEVNGALVHRRLEQLRISPRTPWLVTHALLSSDDKEPPELWGVDLSALALEWSRHEGLRIVVDLPYAQRLGRAWLPEDKALFIPQLPAGQPEPTAEQSAQRAREIAEHALAPLIEALPKDIPGTALEIRVGAEPTPPDEAR